MGSTGQRKCGTPPRATYTPTQVDAYFDTIGLPAKYRKSGIATSKNAASVTPDEAFDFLGVLIKYQLTGIPWENLELHYSSHHTISLDPLHVFHKIVERKHGRGGYCMENTLLLATIARSLGYDVMTTGARVNTSIEPVSATPSWKGPSFNGWNHMVSIVTIGGKKYLVDVGVGSHGPSYPVPLEDGFQAVNVKPNFEISLSREHPDDNTHRQAEEQKMWFYSIRFKQDMDWLIAYAFSELEFLPVDYETMNFFVSKSPKSWFTFHVVCLKWLMDRDTEEIVGDMTLFDGMLNERRKGVGKDLATVKSEEERIRVLDEYFGVKLSGPEKAGIEGMVTQLK